MNTPIIKLYNVKHYDMKKKYSLRVYKDEKLLITGKNGSGKTTLLHMIAGKIKPKSGQVFVKKVQIGYLHSMKYLPNHMKVFEYLHIITQTLELSIDPSLWMILFIDPHKKITELSKGQKQKLLILICFIGNPEIVLLDEPFDGLDATTVHKFLMYLKAYRHSVVLTSHQPLHMTFTSTFTL